MKIKLTDIQVHERNRSHEQELDGNYIDSLKEDIKQNSLIHPVMLLRMPDGTHAIVAGAHRVAALRKLRGEDGYLNEDEYRLMPESTTEEEVVRITVAENAKRHDFTPLAQARYIKKLIEEGCLSQKELAELLGVQRQVIRGMINLVDRFDELPHEWQSDLRAKADGKTAITATHWLEVQAKIPAGAIPDGLMKVLVKAAKQEWSARRTSRAVDGWLKKESARLADEKLEQPGHKQPENAEEVLAAEMAASAPDYADVKQSLKYAIISCGCDRKLSEDICNLIAYCDDAAAGLEKSEIGE